MLDLFHVPTGTGSADQQIFVGTENSVIDNSFITWNKPRGKTMIDILLIGAGGPGGAGVIGAAGGGGGGGAGGGVTGIRMPLWLLPDNLYISLIGMRNNGATALATSRVTVVQPAIAGTGQASSTLVLVNNGGAGGNASGTTAGTAGSAAGAVTGPGMPMGFGFVYINLAGTAGTAGGAGTTTGTTPTAYAPATTGVITAGGTGGGACPTTAASVGTNGGTSNAIAPWIILPGGVGGSAISTPPTDGVSFTSGQRNVFGTYGGNFGGGTGGGGTYAAATGAGLYQASGGNGGWGCGGGGSGGAYTGSTAGRVGYGGPAVCIITVW